MFSCGYGSGFGGCGFNTYCPPTPMPYPCCPRTSCSAIVLVLFILLVIVIGARTSRC